MTSTAYQKLSRIDIAVALDSPVSRFYVAFKELDAFAAALQKWKREDSVARDNVLLAGKDHADYHRAGEDLKEELSYFTFDMITLDTSHLKTPSTQSVDVRACMHAVTKLWEMAASMEGVLDNYDMVLRNMRSKQYRGIDKLESQYNELRKDLTLLIDEKIRNAQFAARAIGFYAPAHASLHATLLSAMSLMTLFRTRLITLKDSHNQSVNNSQPQSTLGALYA